MDLEVDLEEEVDMDLELEEDVLRLVSETNGE